MRKIGGNSFSNTALEEFLAPSALEVIGDEAFRGCKNLKRALLNEGLERLGGCEDEDHKLHGGAFSNTAIQEIALPATLVTLGDNTFRYCC